MPNLSRIKWLRFEPDIGENLSLPVEERFYLEIPRGLTKEQVAAFHSGFFPKMELIDTDKLEGEAKLTAEKSNKAMLATLGPSRIDALEPHLRLGKVPLTIDGGEPLTTVRQYLELFVDQTSLYQLLELSRELTRANSMEGTLELFSARPSGGSSSTADQSNARGETRKAVH